MKFKPETKLFGIRSELTVAMMVAQSVAQEKGIDLLFSSVAERDPVHSATSLHYTGCAFDISKHSFPNGLNQMEDFATELQSRLPKHEFDVIVESASHIHVEFQPKMLTW